MAPLISFPFHHLQQLLCHTDILISFASVTASIFKRVSWHHYCDVIMGTMASQITSLTIVYSTVYSDADQRKHQSAASLAFMRGIHRDRWIPRTNGQRRGKCFHLMTSSCSWKRVHFCSITVLQLVPNNCFSTSSLFSCSSSGFVERHIFEYQ